MVATKISSLVLLRKDGNILLGLKKRGFGAGKWNGFGGKIEEGESILECAKRELFEESGICTEHLINVGYLEFEFIQDPMIMQVHVFTSSTFQGKLRETEEMLPKWYAENELPYHEMWADDKYWFPLFLKGSRFKGYFKFLDFNTIVEHKLEEVTNLNF